MALNKRTSGLPLICLVCGDVARGINFDLMSCMSCKAFFRRHTTKRPVPVLHCLLEGTCQITIRTRGACAACRLKKCLDLGMNPQLIRYSSQKRTKKKSTNLPQPKPLALLQNDRSTLTTDEWTLLSNVIHAYDGANIISNMKSHLQECCARPIKLRSKLSSAFQMVMPFYSSMQTFVERSPYFHQLSSNTCRAILQHNSEAAGAFHCVFLMKELNALENPAFLDACQAIYGPAIFPYLHSFVQHFEQNGTLVKVIFLIHAFSSNCSVVNLLPKENLEDCTGSLSLLRVQNLLVTMFWKYLLYQYGFQGAVKRLDSLLKPIINILGNQDDDMSKNHLQMIDNLVEETTKLWFNDADEYQNRTVESLN